MARRVDLVYGRSGAGKTTFALKLAHYIQQTTGKSTRWYLGDGGGESIYNSGYADDGGFIKVFHYNLRKFPLETTQLICEGYWPERMGDPSSRLLPATQAELDNVGFWVFEGLTVMSDYLMGDQEGGLAWRMARGETLNKDESYALKDGEKGKELKFGGNARTHYGFVQRRMLDLIQRTVGLPGMVLWTAHERRIEDDEIREVLFGPDVCGRALTSRIGGSFGNTVHLQKVHINKKIKDPKTGKEVDKISTEHRLYTTEHMDPEARTYAKYFANTRLPDLVREKDPNFMPEFLVGSDPLEYYERLQQAQVLNDSLLKEATSKRETVVSLF